MDGVHDLGGTNGFGAVECEHNEPTWHEDWEPIGYALAFLGAGELKAFTIDEVRHAIERMDPRHYLASTYYERIVTGTAAMFVEKGLVTQERLEQLANGRFPLATLPGEGEKARTQEINFQPGDRVKVRDGHFRGHSRMPKYVRGKTGTVLHRSKQLFPYAGSAGHGEDAKMEPTYHVCFSAKDLWSDATENSTVVVDLWESYLDPMPAVTAD